MQKKATGVLCAWTLAALVSSAPDAAGQTVLERVRLGNNTEDITVVTRGPLSKNIVVMDGLEAWALPEKVKAKKKAKLEDAPSNLFSVIDLDLAIEPRGLAFIDSEELFALVEPTQPDTLFVIDEQGRLVDTRTIVYLGGYTPDIVEGLVHLPKDSVMYPDHLVLAAMGGDPYARLEVMRPDGQVVTEIIPGAPPEGYITAVGFAQPDRILVSSTTDEFWVLSLDGTVVDGPIPVETGISLEGLVQLRDGRVAAGAYSQGTLFMFDEFLGRLPADDIHFPIGLGLARPRGLAWDSLSDEYLTLSRYRDAAQRDVMAVSAAFDSARTVALPAEDGFSRTSDLAYLPAEGLVAVANRVDPSAILVYDMSGALVEWIDLTAWGGPLFLDYAPATNQFLVCFVGNRDSVSVFDRGGSFLREIDLSPAADQVTGLAFFDPDHPSGGRLMAVDTASRNLVITDLDGDLLDRFDYKTTLGVLSPYGLTAITTGPHAGAFAVMAMDSSELVVFSLDSQ